MLKKILFSLVITGSFIILPIELSARDTGTSQDVIDPTIDSQMDQAIQKAEANVELQLKEATRRDIMPTWNSKLELENAVMQLQVKKTLVENFKGSASLKSALVRNKLIEILNNPNITQADLAELQSIVNEEKAKLNTAK